MAKLHRMSDGWVCFHCPGCEHGHGIPVDGSRGWTWNGSFDSPTISPSILVNVGGGNPTAPICHSFVKDGSIQFLNDCTHKLSGQTVEIPEWEAV